MAISKTDCANLRNEIVNDFGFVSTKGPDYDTNPEDTWFAEVVCFVSIKGANLAGRGFDAVFVRWYKKDESRFDDALGWSPYKPETTQRKDDQGRHPSVPFTDLCSLDSVLEPVFLQRDISTMHPRFFHNIYVR